LGFGLPRPQRGRPMAANSEDGRKIIEELAELSAPYGVTIEYDARRNLGVIRQ